MKRQKKSAVFFAVFGSGMYFEGRRPLELTIRAAVLAHSLPPIAKDEAKKYSLAKE
jgi:hypothetical protein